MSFIERLKSKLASEALQRETAAQKLREQQESHQKSLLDSISREKTLSNERKLQAKAFFEESKIGDLARKFTEVISGSIEEISNFKDISDVRYPESVAFCICWNRIPTGITQDNTGYGNRVRELPWPGQKIIDTMSASFNSRGVNDAVIVKWEIQRAKAITIEVDYEGNIFFEGNWLFGSKVTPIKWKQDSGTLELALEKAYYNARTVTTTGNFHYIIVPPSNL